MASTVPRRMAVRWLGCRTHQQGLVAGSGRLLTGSGQRLILSLLSWGGGAGVVGIAGDRIVLGQAGELAEAKGKPLRLLVPADSGWTTGRQDRLAGLVRERLG